MYSGLLCFRSPLLLPAHQHTHKTGRLAASSSIVGAAMKFKYYIVDVFSPAPFGGNQLAVLPEAKGLTADGMQKIAREFNFAETTFVLPPDNPRHSCKIRIFTPKAELMFAGHPTVGTAVALVLGGHNGSGTISESRS